LLLVKVKVSVEATFAATLVGKNAAVTVGGAGVTVIDAVQALAPVTAEDGAVLLAPEAVKLTMAVSKLRTESVTVSVKDPAPLDVILTCDAAAPETIWTPPIAVHA
jgi:hypothetical protein